MKNKSASADGAEFAAAESLRSMNKNINIRDAAKKIASCSLIIFVSLLALMILGIAGVMCGRQDEANTMIDIANASGVMDMPEGATGVYVRGSRASYYFCGNAKYGDFVKWCNARNMTKIGTESGSWSVLNPASLKNTWTKEDLSNALLNSTMSIDVRGYEKWEKRWPNSGGWTAYYNSNTSMFYGDFAGW